MQYQVDYSKYESPLSKADEIQLTMELLTVSSEGELDNFLGKLFKGIWRGIKKVGGAILKPVGKILKPIGKVLKNVAKKALPWVAGAVGSLFGPAGTAAGTALGSVVSKVLELQLEGMDEIDRQMEMAKRFVRMSSSAIQQAMTAPGSNPIRSFSQALRNSANAIVTPGAVGRIGTSGEWRRYGRKVIVSGV